MRHSAPAQRAAGGCSPLKVTPGRGPAAGENFTYMRLQIHKFNNFLVQNEHIIHIYTRTHAYARARHKVSKRVITKKRKTHHASHTHTHTHTHTRYTHRHTYACELRVTPGKFYLHEITNT